jgi:putative membrane protein
MALEFIRQSQVALAQAPLFWHGHGDPGGWWWLWRLGMFIFWILLFGFFFFWWSRRGGWGGRRERTGVERARDILAERYALGEISIEEYRERLSQLEKLPTS